MEQEKDRINQFLKELPPKIERVNKNMEKWGKVVVEARDEYYVIEKIIEDNKRIVADVQEKSGKACPYCLNFVDENKFSDIINNANEVLEKQGPLFEEATKSYKDAETQYETCLGIKKKIENSITESKTKLAKLDSQISNLYCEISELSKKEKPDADVSELLLCNQIEYLKNQVTEKQELLQGSTPFEGIKNT
ncbi:MAG: hypothetical protein GTO02_11855, partial [Candidatus Dadabacteria bacterium]|nr:hypothetical protein [Candidatus Dadabacteria bacterium]